jgi:DNA-binding CsgD family transcriptional regulator
MAIAEPAPDVLEQLAIAAFLAGREEESDDLRARAYERCLEEGDVPGAARSAFWLGLTYLLRGEPAHAGGWLARARRLLQEHPLDCVEHGYLLLPSALKHVASGGTAAASAAFEQACRIGDRFGDRDLMSLGQLGRGQALIQAGETTIGVALFDEVMVAVTGGEVSPIVAGIVYCAVIGACQEIFDLGRAREWTAALSRWCDSQPDLVPYRGACLISRAEIMQLQGAWTEAIGEARLACEKLAAQPAVGAAYYRLGELHRLRGEVAQAEEAYRQASRSAFDPQPGLALLRLAQGQPGAAEAAISRALEEARGELARPRLLPAFVEVMLLLGDVPAAGEAADELARTASTLNSDYLHAVSAHARGAVLLARGDCAGACSTLRRAWTLWSGLDAPYEAARVRVLIGLACRKQGDEETADMEWDAAQLIFRQLGAGADLAALEALSGPNVRSTRPAGLTPREAQVLALIATGRTNRAIATTLFISERTVERHVSNIFLKTGVSSRAAATAWAYEHPMS